MTNRLELNWKLDGFVDEQRYYCSETQIDLENLPAPKAVLANDVRSYVDAAVDVDKTYYVAVGSVKNGVEKVSEVKQVSTVVTNDPFADYVVLYMPLDGDFTQVIGSKTITPKGANNSFASDGIGGKKCYVAGSASYFTFGLASFFNNHPFCIEYYASTGGSDFDGMSSFGGTESVDYATLTHTSASFWMSRNNASWTNGNNALYRATTLTHFAFTWDGVSSFRVFVNGVIQSTLSIPSFTQTKTMALIGKKTDGLANSTTNKFQHLRITKGHARYATNFTPPTEFIY